MGNVEVKCSYCGDVGYIPSGLGDKNAISMDVFCPACENTFVVQNDGDNELFTWDPDKGMDRISLEDVKRWQYRYNELRRIDEGFLNIFTNGISLTRATSIDCVNRQDYIWVFLRPEVLGQSLFLCVLDRMISSAVERYCVNGPDKETHEWAIRWLENREEDHKPLLALSCKYATYISESIRQLKLELEGSCVAQMISSYLLDAAFAHGLATTEDWKLNAILPPDIIRVNTFNQEIDNQITILKEALFMKGGLKQ